MQVDDAGPRPVDAATTLDAPGDSHDAGGTTGELDAALEPGTDAALDPSVDAGAMGTSDGGAQPDAARVSMPCTAAGACDPFRADGCGTGMACRAGAAGAPTACTATAATLRAVGEACTAGSQCVGGSACLDFGDGQRCHALCPMGSIGHCGATAVCTGTITGGDACIQVCRALPPRCDIYAQDCSDPTQACTFATNAETGERYTGCRPAGTRTDGQPCGGEAGSCARGLVCITEDGASSCHHACDPTLTPTSCPASQACTGTARSWGVGYCQPR